MTRSVLCFHFLLWSSGFCVYWRIHKRLLVLDEPQRHVYTHIKSLVFFLLTLRVRFCSNERKINGSFHMFILLMAINELHIVFLLYGNK